MSVPTPAATRQRERPDASASLWRAMRHLIPRWRYVTVSIICALFAGLTLTGGLGALLPILRLLIHGDTIKGWAARQAVEHRLSLTLADDATGNQILKIDEKGFGWNAGLRKDFVLDAAWPANQSQPPPQPLVSVPGLSATIGPTAQTLWTLSDPALREVRIQWHLPGGGSSTLDLPLPPLPIYLVWSRALGGWMPLHPVWAMAELLGFVLILTIVGNIVRFFQEYYSDKAAILAVNDLRRRLYDHVLRMPLGYFGLKGTSDVTSRLVQDAQGLQDGFKTVLGQTIQEPIKAAMAFGVALLIDWHLTIFIVLFGPLMFSIIKKFGKKMRRASRKALQSSAVMLGQLEATLSGLRVVKAGTAERFERRRYTGIMAGLVGEQLHMSRIDAMSSPILETLTFLVVGLIVLYACYLVRISQTLSGDKFMTLMACLMAIGESLRRCSKVNNSLQKANAAAARIFELMDVPVERRQKVIGKPTSDAASLPIVLPPIQRELCVDNVTFSYANLTSPALCNVSLTVPKGQCVAVVGRNGSGKTTLLSLLPRFYDPQEGRILIDGVDLRQATLRSVRRQIGIVTQDAVIFPGTIRENIRYGLPLSAEQEIVAAAKRAFAHDFIMEKPHGYDTLLGEHGAQLSGGQRQRLCIARAILRQTPILILDEATSQVDAESEHLIQQAIESLMHERTTFVIAHRLGTILSADTIVVMDRGRIVGQGRHEELLQSCPTYQQLYERQLFSTVPAADRGALPV